MYSKFERDSKYNILLWCEGQQPEPISGDFRKRTREDGLFIVNEEKNIIKLHELVMDQRRVVIQNHCNRLWARMIINEIQTRRTHKLKLN